MEEHAIGCERNVMITSAGTCIYTDVTTVTAKAGDVQCVEAFSYLVEVVDDKEAPDPQ